MGRRRGIRGPQDRAGERALILGIAALVAGFVPGIGEIVAVPAAVLAIVLGMIGVRRYETGRATTVVPATAGVALGALALVVTSVVFVATHASP